MQRLVNHLSTRKRRGCSSPEPHSHHLTWVGKLRYT